MEAVELAVKTRLINEKVALGTPFELQYLEQISEFS